MSEYVCQVCIPHTHRDYYDYLPVGKEIAIGSRVLVSFRKKECIGIVVGIGLTAVSLEKLKPIMAVLDSESLIDDKLFALARWVSDYYQSPLSEVISLVFPKKLRVKAEVIVNPVQHYQLAYPLAQAESLLAKNAAKKRALVKFLASQPEPVSLEHLKAAGFSKIHLTALSEQNLILCSEPRPVYNRCSSVVLNAEQEQAITCISSAFYHYSCFLLQGVTGSGKTEVYLQLTAKVLADKKQTLILVPEIGLTPQLIKRFQQRFSLPVAVIHSALNETERYCAWEMARSNKAAIVLGTRAAIFTPMPQLGLIIIDEEHDGSLKQMDGAHYSARDTALVRAQTAGIPVVLGTATPSLESLYNCQMQKYQLVQLTRKALNDNALLYNLVDLRNTPMHQGLANTTINTIHSHLAQGNQVLIFLNRRGFAPVLLCHCCGWIADCPACDSHLTLHRQAKCLICHHCGKTRSTPTACIKCSSPELLPVGIGTQRLQEFLQDHFANYQVLRIDRDEVSKKNELHERLQQIARGEAQLIVGTQMLAKGHHFPNLTLVVIAETDAGLYHPDFRALEQLGQLITQVAGRAGRADKPGEVILQTHAPDHPFLRLLVQKGYDQFAQALLAQREQANMPPYSYLALIRAQANKQAAVFAGLKQMKLFLRDYDIQVFGPAPASLPRKANYYRMQLLLKSAQRKRLQSALTALREWLTINKNLSNLRWTIDVDPLDLS